MRISDWSSDVCSSDLRQLVRRLAQRRQSPARDPQLRPDRDRETSLRHRIDPYPARAIGRLPGLAGLEHRALVVGYIRRRHVRIDAVVGAVVLDLEIGRAHVLTLVTNAHFVCRLLLEKKICCYDYRIYTS